MKQGEAWPRTTEFINDMVTGDSHKSDFGGVMEMESQSKRGGDCVQMTLSRHFFSKNRSRERGSSWRETQKHEMSIYGRLRDCKNDPAERKGLATTKREGTDFGFRRGLSRYRGA